MENKKNKINEEFEDKPIPTNERKSLWSMIIVMAGFSIFSATIWVGADIASSFNPINMVWIIIVGNILLATYISFLGYIGAESGLSMHMLSKRVFGKHGYKITSMVALISQLGWFGVGVMMFSNPLANLLGISNFWLIELIVIPSGMIMIASAFLGIKALEKVSLVAVPLVIVFGFIMIGLGVSGDDWSPFPTDPNKYTNVEAIGLVFATFVSGGTMAPDFVRWAKNGKSAVISIVIAFLVCSTLMLVFGAVAFYSTGKGDLSDALIVMNLAIPGIIVLGANIWTTNDNSLYTQGLAGSVIFGVPKRKMILLLGGIGIILAPLFNLYFISFLDLLNLFLPGIGAILILNWFFFKNNNEEKKFDILSLFSWTLGIIISFIIQIFLPFIIPMYVIIFTTIIYSIGNLISNK